MRMSSVAAFASLPAVIRLRRGWPFPARWERASIGAHWSVRRNAVRVRSAHTPWGWMAIQPRWAGLLVRNLVASDSSACRTQCLCASRAQRAEEVMGGGAAAAPATRRTGGGGGASHDHPCARPTRLWDNIATLAVFAPAALLASTRPGGDAPGPRAAFSAPGTGSRR